LRTYPIFAAGAAAVLSLSSCGGPEALTLPTERVDRAATCGVVAAAEARLAASAGALPLRAQGRILHYVLLAASSEGGFSRDTATAVNARMQALQDRVTSGKWQDLAPACRQAFAVAEKTEVELPSARFDAQIQCEELAEFTADSLKGQAGSYANEIGAYRRLRGQLNDAMAGPLRQRAGASLDAQREERSRALAAAAQLGSPVPVLDACLSRFD
jgi:hypothetical protein